MSGADHGASVRAGLAERRSGAPPGGGSRVGGNSGSGCADHLHVNCDACRSMVSARLDGEEELSTLAEAHLRGCAACRGFATGAESLARRTRLRPAEPIPDLTDLVLARHRVRRDRRVELVRYALGVVAVTQLLLAVPAVLWGSIDGLPVHTGRELGAWGVALAIGLLVAAVQPSRARGLLPMAAALVVAMTIGAVADVVEGDVGVAAESVHAIHLAGVAGLWALRREVGSSDAMVSFAT
ncbi:MAG: hypothetical protein S0880_04480 [Actinomycetota bacterium]|nr:hypothetical protein [Actinomycetota bacterium]